MHRVYLIIEGEKAASRRRHGFPLAKQMPNCAVLHACGHKGQKGETHWLICIQLYLKLRYFILLEAPPDYNVLQSAAASLVGLGKY